MIQLYPLRPVILADVGEIPAWTTKAQGIGSRHLEDRELDRTAKAILARERGVSGD